MIVETLPVGLLQCNCSILACEDTREAIVVDPGGDVERIEEILDHYQLTVRMIVHTHAHIDHVLGTRELKERRGGEILLHPEDCFLYDNLAMQGQLLGLTPDETAPIDAALSDNQTLGFGKDYLLVLHTPGHTPGSVSFTLRRGHPTGASEEQLLLSGDTLFRGGIGRTDLWGGDSAKLFGSIRSRLLSLDDETRVIPGHGPETRIGEERRSNPFLNM